MKLLEQAELSGDTVMVRAVIQRAIEPSWNQVANSYAKTRPYDGEKLKELLSLQKPAGIFTSRDTMEAGLLLQVHESTELGW